jgi:peptidoglycan/xylan/chitin deacetylase (PgdA/CDA1 family)
MVRSSRRTGVELRPWIPAPIAFDEPGRACAIGVLLGTYVKTPDEQTEDLMNMIAEATGSGRADRSVAEGVWMTWHMVRKMKSAGMTIGGHTVNHPVLSRMSLQAQWQEISECSRRFAEQLDQPMLYFSYPIGRNGAFNDDTRACLRQAGVRYAFSYFGGYGRFEEWDDHNIRRIAVESNVSIDLFRSMVIFPDIFCRPG